MGILNGLMGHASEADAAKFSKQLDPVLIEGEQTDLVFKVMRDLIVFTNKRLLLIDKQGMTGKKVEFKSIPYGKINRFSVENAGTFDLESELKIWVAGRSEPIEKHFKKGDAIEKVHKALASYVL